MDVFLKPESQGSGKAKASCHAEDDGVTGDTTVPRPGGKADTGQAKTDDGACRWLEMGVGLKDSGDTGQLVQGNGSSWVWLEHRLAAEKS